MNSMDLHDKIRKARSARQPRHPYGAKPGQQIAPELHVEYETIANRIFAQVDYIAQGEILHPLDADQVIEFIRSYHKRKTILKYARAVRYVSLRVLGGLLSLQDQYQRVGDQAKWEAIVASDCFSAWTKLCEFMPADYLEGCTDKKKRSSKADVLRDLPENWREMIYEKCLTKAVHPKYALPILLLCATGCRPKEIENGAVVRLDGNQIEIEIKGAKVSEQSGQEFRKIRLRKSIFESELRDWLVKAGTNEATVQFEPSNSLTTHIRNLAKELWPKNKKAVTSYVFRHAIANDTRANGREIGDPLAVSKVLGHRVDKTASFYGGKSLGRSHLSPLSVQVPRPIVPKKLSRDALRSIPKSPSRKRKKKS